MRDRAWLMRTYGGHSSARASNELYRANLAKGQTGLSVAFDLPTQLGYDPDHELARGEVGKVGVPVAHLGDMRALFAGIPLGRANTSLTINGSAAWILALYRVVAEEQGARAAGLAGTTQNDIIKEFLSRGAYIFGPGPSLRLATDLIEYTVTAMPRWNPINICSYHLREAGATPVQEIAFSLANAIAVLDAVRESGRVPVRDVAGRVSFFVNAGVRFVEEMCKIRAFGELWCTIARERYGVAEPRFRYGVQVGSLDLARAQPENNVARILLSMLGVVLSKSARARAVQLPAWNEALGLPRPWDQQWSLRMQQVLAAETDLLEYADIVEGSPVVRDKTAELRTAAQAEIDRILSLGGAVAAIDLMRSELTAAFSRRRLRQESGAETLVGVNAFTETTASPLLADVDTAVQAVDPCAEAAAVAAVREWRRARDAGAAGRALDGLRDAAKGTRNVLPATLECARAGVTTGEWADALREVFGEHRAPGGVSGPVAGTSPDLDRLRLAVRRAAGELGRPPRLLVGKPGLDGHSNGAQQVALRARDAGFEVIYLGIRLTPAQIAAAAAHEDADCVGLSIMSGSHAEVIPAVLAGLRAHGLDDVPVVVGGVIPAAGIGPLLGLGVAAVFTSEDYTITAVLAEILEIIRSTRR